MATLGLTSEQIERYSRQIILKDVGSIGMKKLLDATVVIVGAGGLGCPAAQILASSGVGTIKIVDGDHVELSNLPRQIMHFTTDIGHPKVESIQSKINKMNPDVNVQIFNTFVNKENISDLIQGADYVIEASDNPATKFLVNDACIFHGIPFSIAGVVDFFGQIISVVPGKTACYRCIFKDIFEDDPQTSCSGSGVISTVPTFAGNLQAHECIKSILGIKQGFVNMIFSFDLKDYSFDFIPIKQDTNCKACSDPSIPYYQSVNYLMKTNACDMDKEDH
jgi:molybdopterin-synthase adenylyltransferase